MVCSYISSKLVGGGGVGVEVLMMMYSKVVHASPIP